MMELARRHANPLSGSRLAPIKLELEAALRLGPCQRPLLVILKRARPGGSPFGAGPGRVCWRVERPGAAGASADGGVTGWARCPCDVTVTGTQGLWDRADRDAGKFRLLTGIPGIRDFRRGAEPGAPLSLTSIHGRVHTRRRVVLKSLRPREREEGWNRD